MAEQEQEKVKIFDRTSSIEEGVEVIPSPEAEKKVEEIKSAEAASEKREEKAEEKVVLVPPIGQSEGVMPADPLVEKIEQILEEDLGDVYLQMTQEEQREFKGKGEETASKIRILIQQFKLRAKEILKLIKDWLTFIPGVNKYFMEQEAKIKTDKILEMAEEQKKK